MARERPASQASGVNGNSERHTDRGEKKFGKFDECACGVYWQPYEVPNMD